LVIYFGEDLANESSILRVFDCREEAFDWVEEVAKGNNVSPGLRGTDAELYEVMVEHFKIDIRPWYDIKENPSLFPNWDVESLWAMVNNDFSQLTQERWERLKSRIHFPRVEINQPRKTDNWEILYSLT
jgi:hypothetical protein